MQSSFADWQKWNSSGAYTMLPAVVEMSWEEGLPLTWEPFWAEASTHSFVLESGRSGRYTYVGLRPISILRGKGGQAIETRCTAAEAEAGGHMYHGKPLAIIRDWMDRFRSPMIQSEHAFLGGVIGYLSYDVVRSLEKMPEKATDDLELPDYALMMVDECFIYDHQARKLTACVHQYIARGISTSEMTLFDFYEQAMDRAHKLLSEWQWMHRQGQAKGQDRGRLFQLATHTKTTVDDAERHLHRQANMSKQQFVTAVERIREYIAAGDVFQVNLSMRQDQDLTIGPEVLYEWLRQLNPSPYMGLIRFEDFSLVSVSPELLVKKAGQRLITRPIAGTRRRGNTAAEDMALEHELRTNEKEIAEHVMLVDLERNDLGKVSEFGTVRVDDLMVIERYSHVMHLVSGVSGRLTEDRDALDTLAAVFPGGTITGAPKIRTMEIIEELEPTRRGPYTGSFGWIDYNGNMEFNIIIRTMIIKQGKGYVQAGAGIVIDSIPEREYRESLNKAKALWQAVQYAEQYEQLVSVPTEEENSNDTRHR